MAQLMQGKRGLIMGVANDHSIAWGIARTLAAHGATLAFTYQGEALGRRVKPLAQSIGASLLLPCDVEQIASADAVYCMTASQRLAAIELCPDARAKIHRLEPDADIPDPSGAPLDVFVEVANRIERAVRDRLASFAPAHA